MNKFKVKIPGGYLIVEEKGAENEYPGVFISFSKNGNECDKNYMVTCVEYDSCAEELRTVTYCDEHDEPTHIICCKNGRDLM